MQFLIETWYLFAVAIVSGGLLAWPFIANRSAAGSVSTAEAVRLVNRERALLIDVSEPAEYAAGHAAGSRSVPLGTLDTAKNLPTNKALPLVVVCANGARSGKAAGMLQKRGFEKAMPLAGGLKAWREANLPIEKSA